MSARGFSGKEEEGDLDAKIAEMLAAAGEGNSVNSMDTEDYIQQQVDIAKEEEAAEIAEMSPEELFFSRHGLPASTEKAEQDKLEEELAEHKEQMRKEANDRRSGVQKNRQAFAGHKYGGGKKRTIRKKNRKGIRTTIRKRQRKNRTRTMRKKARKSRNSRKSNKAR